MKKVLLTLLMFLGCLFIHGQEAMAAEGAKVAPVVAPVVAPATAPVPSPVVAPVVAPAVLTPAPVSAPVVVPVDVKTVLQAEVVAPVAPVVTSEVVTPVEVAAPAAVVVPVPQNKDQAVAQAEQTISAFEAGKYIAAVVLLIGILIFLYRKFGKNTPAGTPPTAAA